MYGYPVTGPMYIPYENVRSPYGPEWPETKELPGIIDAKTEGLRLHGTSAKALPRMKGGGSGTDARQREAEELAYKMKRAYAITRAYQKQNKRHSEASERKTDEYAKNLGKRQTKSKSLIYGNTKRSAGL